jgi:hypothetical protein
MNLYQTRIPAPQDWQQLQRIAKDFYEHKYPVCTVDEYGTHGQAQDGVDVYVYGAGAATAVQCKCVESFSVNELRDEFAKTEAFKNSIKHYIVLVTVKRDTKLVDEAVKLTMSNERGIRVEVKFWQALAEELAGVSRLASKYLSFAARFPVYVSTNSASAFVILETEDSR